MSERQKSNVEKAVEDWCKKIDLKKVVDKYLGNNVRE